MSDLEKAEELLRKVKRVLEDLQKHSAITFSEAALCGEIEEYFWEERSVISHDAGGSTVRFYIDRDGDVAVEWQSFDMPDIYFEPGTLANALRDLGVIE